MPDRYPFIQLLSTNGDGTGTRNILGNYSVTPAEFYIQCPVGSRIFITHLHAVVAASGALNMADYGAVAGGLVNGIAVTYSIGGVTGDFLKGYRIKTNIDFLALGDISITNFAGTAQAIKCEGDFPGQYTDSIQLDAGDWLKVTANDNFTSLVDHAFAVWGAIQPV